MRLTLHTFVLLLTGSLGLFACNREDETQGGPLAGGDAEWPQAPIPQPGGEGQGGNDDGVGDDGVGGDTSGGGESSTSGDGDGDGDFPCEPAPDGLTCDAAPGVCEAVPWTDWGGTTTGVFAADIIVDAHDRQGLLRDISEIFTRERLNVVGVNTQSKQGKAHMSFTVEITNLQQLQKTLTLIHDVEGVVGVRRA